MPLTVATACPSCGGQLEFEHGAKEIAYLNGWGITFMAKPDHTWTGSSGHLHMSLWDVAGDRPLTYDPDAALPYGMSKLFSQFVAGMMRLSRELAIFIAPNINSYKRYASLSWAPVNVVWGRDNRTTGFRLVGHGPALHVEDRFPGGDMNAYLTYAAMVGAGLYGMLLFAVLAVFIAVYAVFLIISISFVDANTPLDDRILSPAYAAGVVILLYGLDRVWPVIRRNSALARGTVVLLGAFVAGHAVQAAPMVASMASRCPGSHRGRPASASVSL